MYGCKQMNNKKKKKCMDAKNKNVWMQTNE